MMKTIGTGIALIAALALAGCGRMNSEIADLDHLDELEARTMELSGFDEILLKGDAAVIVNIGEAFAVTLYTEDDHFDELDLFVDDGVLTLEHDDEHFSTANVALVVTMPALESFRVRGAVDARLNDLDQERFELRIAGAGNIEITGTCGEAELQLAGAGNISARRFECENVEADLAGAGHLEVYASEAINVRVAGIGNIEVYGSPTKVRRRLAGLGSIDIH